LNTDDKPVLHTDITEEYLEKYVPSHRQQ
jgi:hypothetical protein